MSNFSRKVLSLVLCLVMVLSTFGPVFGDTTTSDYGTHWAKNAIEAARETGIMKGYPDGTFRPNNAITRAEFFSLVNNTFGYTAVSAITFTDVSTNAWYAPVVAKAKAAGYILGYPDGGIHPNSYITRQEVAVVMSRIKSLTATGNTLGFTDTSLIAGWSKQAVIAVFEAKIMTGYPDGSFKPKAFITRAEALVTITNSFVYGLKDLVYDKAGIYGSLAETVTIEGNVVIKAAGTTLKNTIIKGDLTIAKEVGEGDVTLKNVTVLGDTYVKGGGVNSIYFIDVTLGKVYVQKDDGPVRIVASGTSVIKEVIVGSDVILVEIDLTGPGFVKITVEENAVGGIDITLIGVKVDSIDINTEGVTLNIDANSIVKELTIYAKNTVVKGTGTITSAIINANGVTFEKSPTTITTAPGITAPVITAPVIGGGGGGGGGGGSSTPAAVEVTLITVTGAGAVAVITTDNGTLQMSAAVLPTNATNPAVTWSVAPGTGSATISAGGLLTAVTNGNVTVTATSVSTGSVTGTLVITLSNQVLSSDATLSLTSMIKGQTLVSVGTPSAVIVTASSGAVTITAAKAANTTNATTFVTLFVATDAGATVSRVVQYATGAATDGFATDTVYTTAAITNGDFFIIKVTAEDTTVLYYKVTVTVLP